MLASFAFVYNFFKCKKDESTPGSKKLPKIREQSGKLSQRNIGEGTFFSLNREKNFEYQRNNFRKELTRKRQNHLDRRAFMNSSHLTGKLVRWVKKFS